MSDHSATTDRRPDQVQVINLRGCLPLLAVAFVAFACGALTVILGPNFDLVLATSSCEGGMSKLKQKRTVADIYNLAVALECYRLAYGDYPVGELSELGAVLAPTFISAVPMVDGWKRPFVYVGGSISPNRRGYVLASLGCDGSFGVNPPDLDGRKWALDTVMVDGRWHRPELIMTPEDRHWGPLSCAEPPLAARLPLRETP